MKGLFAKILLAALCAFAWLPAAGAEGVVFEASSPLMVAVGEAFRVEFALNAKPDKESFEAPSFEGFDVLAGPAVSEGSSIRIINGSMSKSVNYTITYVLVAQSAGNLTVGPAAIAVDGETYHTRPLPIEIVDEGGSASPGGSGSAQPRPQQSAGNEAQGRVGSDDILLRAVVSRSSVFKGEPLRVAFKLYERAAVVGYQDYKVPSFNGFWAQQLDNDNPRRQRETFNGKVYETTVAWEYLLYPQQAGTLTIEPAELTAVVQVIVQNNRRLDPFFGGPEIHNVPKRVQSQRVNITVKPLPAGAPAGFSGAVGRFSMETKLPDGQLSANSAATYTVKISGTGNLTFVQAPKLSLPGSFEQYNVKTTESINASASGISGYRQFEYPFIARAEGTFDIEPVEFSYFDPSRMEYATLRSEPLTLNVAPDAKGGSGGAVVMQGRGMSKEEVRLLGEDIRFIKLGAAQLHAPQRPLLFSGLYWALLCGILLLFGAAYATLRKRIRESQNVALVRGRRANKVAVQRFRTARKYMEEADRHAFYEEMLHALWGYVSDKFNIPVANLTKENVREELHRRGVSADESQRFTAIIACCDEAQYSPAASARMSDVYADGVDLVSRIESAIKR